jgi:hypothetical protein
MFCVSDAYDSTLQPEDMYHDNVCGIFAQSKDYGVTKAGRYQAAVPKQQKNSVFCAARVYGCSRNNGVCHATVKKQLHCNRGTVFPTRSVPKFYNQNKL